MSWFSRCFPYTAYITIPLAVASAVSWVMRYPDNIHGFVLTDMINLLFFITQAYLILGLVNFVMLGVSIYRRDYSLIVLYVLQAIALLIIFQYGSTALFST